MINFKPLTLAFIPFTLIAGCTSAQSRDFFPNDGIDDALALQAEIDAKAATGGGTVELEKGIYNLSRSVYLRDNIVLKGVGPETILTNEGLNKNTTWRGVTLFAGTLAPASFTYNGGRGHRGYRVQQIDGNSVKFAECEATATKPVAGDVVWLASTEGEIGRGKFHRPYSGEMHLVTGTSDCTVSFADPVTTSEDYDIDLHWAEKDRVRYKDVEGNRPIMQAAVRDLQLRSQASQAMLTTGCYACEFTDLTIGKSRRLLAVQGMRNGVYRNITGVFGERGIEFAMFATDNVVENISGRYEPREGYPLRPAVRLGESARNNLIQDVDLDLSKAVNPANTIRFDESSDNVLQGIAIIVAENTRSPNFIYRTAGAERGQSGRLPSGTYLRDVEQCVRQADGDKAPQTCAAF